MILECQLGFSELPVQVFSDVKCVKSGGIEIKGLRGRAIHYKKTLAEPVLEKYVFIPYHLSNLVWIISVDNNPLFLM